MVVEAPIRDYPHEEPRVYIEPKPECQHWLRGDGDVYLCFQPERKWNENRSTFATKVAAAIAYLRAFA